MNTNISQIKLEVDNFNTAITELETFIYSRANHTIAEKEQINQKIDALLQTMNWSLLSNNNRQEKRKTRLHIHLLETIKESLNEKTEIFKRVRVDEPLFLNVCPQSAEDMLLAAFFKKYSINDKDVFEKINDPLAIDKGRPCTPLYLAIYHNEEDVVKALLNRGASLCLLDENNHTLFDSLVFKGKISSTKMIKTLLEKEDLCNFATINSLLYSKIEEKDYEAVEFFVSKGADLNFLEIFSIPNPTGQTQIQQVLPPLSIAITTSSIEIIELLLNNDAKINNVSLNNNSLKFLLRNIIKNKNKPLKKLIIEEIINFLTNENSLSIKRVIKTLDWVINQENTRVIKNEIHSSKIVLDQLKKKKRALKKESYLNKVEFDRLTKDKDDNKIQINSLKEVLKNESKKADSEQKKRTIEKLKELSSQNQKISRKLSDSIIFENEIEKDNYYKLLNIEIVSLEQKILQAEVLLNNNEFEACNSMFKINVLKDLKINQSIIYMYLLGCLDYEHTSFEKLTSIYYRLTKIADPNDKIKSGTVLLMLYELSNTKFLTNDEKIKLLKKLTEDGLFNKENECENLQESEDQKTMDLKQLSDFYYKNKNIDSLNRFSFTTNCLLLYSENQIEILKQIIDSKDCQIDQIMYNFVKNFIKEELNISIEGYGEKYDATIGLSRDPIQIFSYIINLQIDAYNECEEATEIEEELEKNEIDLFSDFISDILQDKYKQNRYCLEKNSHLNYLFTNKRDLYEIWQQNRNLKLGELVQDNFMEKYKNYQVSESDDPYEILFSGNDFGTCMKLDSLEGMNSGLLGPLLDGKYKIISVKNEKGQSVARCYLKILEQNEEPVLFMEQHYFRPKYFSFLSKALNQMCILKAKEMNMNLLYYENDDRNFSGQIFETSKPVTSLGSRSTVEYVDALIENTNGKYELPPNQENNIEYFKALHLAQPRD